MEREEPQNEEYIYTGKALVLETDSDRIITYANRRFVETSGYSKEEMIGSPHCMHLHPDMPAGIFKDACRLTDEGKTWSGLVQNVNKKGISYWTELLIQPKINEMGKIIGYMATRREMDTSKLGEVKKEYEMMRAAGEETVKGQFCGEVYLGESACAF
ncbi:hypothetical protein YH65_00175 [Sulfurovum lithotrophicum]|uniref:PAS domain-containing protein n=1 Tax=Sulfurovum lithotrophicum TaxID=206403 RepID=A0A7U4RRI7_9BACT|nr:hypothetical protein YH65_00175 [Sulfurovum lithotrophicum]